MTIIEQLKKNEKAFGLMSEEMQEKAEQLGPLEFESYNGGNVWFPFGKIGFSKDCYGKFVCWIAYRLRPDYAKEPEIVECEIYENLDGNLMYRQAGVGRMLSIAVNKPDFIGFKFEDGYVSGAPVMYSMPATHGRYESLKNGDCEVEHATHVLFRRPK